MVNVEIVTIGTEILLGDLVDTNAAHVARALADAGVDVFAKHSVGDNATRLEAMLRGVLERADGAITTGGLGPTVDDLTKDAVARVIGVELELHESSLRAVEERFALLGRTMSENNRRQAFVPRGAVVLENPHGTAPGFVAVRDDGKFIACMPGVPREMRPMLAERLVPWLRQRFALASSVFTRTIHTIGWPESEVDHRIDDLFRSLDNPKIGVLAHAGRVDVKIMAKAKDRATAQALIEPVEREVRSRLGRGIFGIDDESLEAVIVDALAARGLTLATAESMTGGGIADAIVRVPGASRVFRGGVVAYDDAVKVDLLDVARSDLEARGAVSEHVARAMALGARARLKSDMAIATTGIAGPAGGTTEKPVGLVWFGLAKPDGKVVVRCVTLPGEREDIRRRAVIVALDMLWRCFETLEPEALTNRSSRICT